MRESRRTPRVFTSTNVSYRRSIFRRRSRFIPLSRLILGSGIGLAFLIFLTVLIY